MANINELSGFMNGDILTEKLNEIIDWVNGVTSEKKVASMSISSNVITVTYFDGSKKTLNVKNTTYSLATKDANGLMASSGVVLLQSLSNTTNALYSSYDAYLKKLKEIEEMKKDNEAPDDGSGGDFVEGGGDGGGSSSGGTSGGSGGGTTGGDPSGGGGGVSDGDVGGGNQGE